MRVAGAGFEPTDDRNATDMVEVERQARNGYPAEPDRKATGGSACIR